MRNFEVVIGIEIHLELNTKTKLFSNARNDFHSLPNTNVNVIDLGYPGTLPSLNKEAVIKAIKLGKALKMNIDHELHFDRKNYYYTDIPKGFQITQQFRPIGKNGVITLFLNNGKTKDIKINRIHIEEDTARQIHTETETLINYNRAGVPLIEIVSEPEINSIDEAINYIDLIRTIAIFLNISDSKMSEGSLRADINLSLRMIGDKRLGQKVEIKNINSLNNVKKAIEFEIDCQTRKIMNGIEIKQETKRFDEDTSENIVMREKNDDIDYKYFKEPNIPPIILDNDWINKIIIEELPWEKRERYKKDGIPDSYIELLMNNLQASIFFDSIKYNDRELLAKFFFSEVMQLAKNSNLDIQNLKIKQQNITDLIDFFIEGIISGKQLKEFFPKLIDLKTSVKELIQQDGLKQISNYENLSILINDIIKENPNLKLEFIERRERCIKFVMGQLMKITKGQANPILSTEITIKALEKYAKEE
ncbi:MAG: Asp-tRNA(Asn)/Glu-tRNA(Gln) amidotransferase subunit GatB [Metamycoplasmataceae bacterium]